MPDPLPAPDDKRLFLLLRKTGLNEEQTYTFVQELRNMAAENIIARFESKLDAAIQAQSTAYKTILWVIGVAFALVAALKFIPVQ